LFGFLLPDQFDHLFRNAACFNTASKLKHLNATLYNSAPFLLLALVFAVLLLALVYYPRVHSFKVSLHLIALHVLIAYLLLPVLVLILALLSLQVGFFRRLFTVFLKPCFQQQPASLLVLRPIGGCLRRTAGLLMLVLRPTGGLSASNRLA
jgi:hypothetical protein